MARPASGSAFICQSCGASFARWEGQCRACGTWNALVETLVQRGSRRGQATRHPRSAAGTPTVLSLDQLGREPLVRRSVSLPEVDRVLGGGLVPGEVLLLGGEPGIGKSTLVLQIASAVAPAGGVLYATAEESAGQLRLRAERLGLLEGASPAALSVIAATEVEDIVEAATLASPALLIVDSIQTVDAGGLEGPPGSVGQVREAAARLGGFAREHGVPVLLVGQVTKDGSLAGPRSLEHLVDAVLMLEGDRHGALRLLRSLKNRYGPTDEVGVLEMGASGLREVSDATSAFLGGGPREGPGLAVAAILEGSRSLLVEVQALVAPAGFGPPRRTVAGIDPSRLGLLVAVLSRRAGVDVSSRDVYVSLTGGVSVTEPALDLAVALAVASSHRDRALTPGCLALGEISLLGEVRPVPGMERRLREAERLGFRRAIVPLVGAGEGRAAGGDGAAAGRGRRADGAAGGVERVPVRALREALEVGLTSE